MNIGFKTGDARQTLEEYNLEITEGEDEIEKGEFITAQQSTKNKEKVLFC